MESTEPQKTGAAKCGARGSHLSHSPQRLVDGKAGKSDIDEEEFGNLRRRPASEDGANWDAGMNSGQTSKNGT